MEDNAICARVLLGLSNDGYFLSEFLKISLGPPFALFQKMGVLGDVAKIAITWPFGYFWSRLVRQNLVQSLHFKSILIRGKCHLRQCAFGPFQGGHLFERFFEKFPLVPRLRFFRKCGFSVTLQKLP